MDKCKKTKDATKRTICKQDFRGNPLQHENYYQKLNKQQQIQTDQATHAQRQPGNSSYYT